MQSNSMEKVAKAFFLSQCRNKGLFAHVCRCHPRYKMKFPEEEEEEEEEDLIFLVQKSPSKENKKR